MDLIKPDIFKYSNAQKYIKSVVKKNKVTADKLKELLKLKSSAYAWSIYTHGVISSRVSSKIIEKFKLNKKEATYFKLLVEIPKLSCLTLPEKSKLIELIHNNYKTNELQKNNTKTA